MTVVHTYLYIPISITPVFVLILSCAIFLQKYLFPLRLSDKNFITFTISPSVLHTLHPLFHTSQCVNQSKFSASCYLYAFLQIFAISCLTCWNHLNIKKPSEGFMQCWLVNSHLHFKHAHFLHLHRQCRKSEHGLLDPVVEGFTNLPKHRYFFTGWHRMISQNTWMWKLILNKCSFIQYYR